jgi:hypothetical protein
MKPFFCGEEEEEGYLRFQEHGPGDGRAGTLGDTTTSQRR